MPEDDKPKVSMDELRVSLKQYIDARLEDRAEAVRVSLEAQLKAVDKAEQQLRERLAGMNEFRDTLRDQASKFITRDESLMLHRATDERMRGLEQFRANIEGRILTLGAVWAFIVIAVNYLIRLAFE